MIDTGVGFVHPMFFIGVVEDRNDPRAEGRVRVRAFGIHGSNQDIPTEELPWATLIIGNHDVNFTPPPLNAWVFGFFIDGRDAQQPMILGLIPAQATEIVNPAVTGWGAVPAEDYDRAGQGTRPRDLGLSPMSKLATGEFLNETYNEALETNRVRDIPIAGGCARGHNSVGNGNLWGNDIGESVDGTPTFTPGRAGRGLTEDRQRALVAFANRNGINPNALAGVLNIESGFDPSIQGGASNRFHGIFQLQDSQIGGLTNQALGRSLSPEQYRQISFDDQLRVYEQYMKNSIKGNLSDFFTGDAKQDASRLWALQLAPGRARSIDYNNSNATISATNQASSISAKRGLVTVGSVQGGTISRGGLLDLDKESLQTPQLLEDPSQPSRTEQAQLNDQRQSKADEIRTQIRDVDRQISELKLPEDNTRLQELQSKRQELEAELSSLDSSSTTDATPNEPYSGYATPSSDPSCATSWEEPASGYGAKYPYNRVIETASGHSIELDDTPGSERIMIWHHSGSYVQITGTSTTHKNMSDAYSVNERNHHVYIGGNNLVTIEGDSHVLVKGNKVEEIEGDYKQIVHGNIMVGGGGRVEINGADRTDIRSASLALDSNVENLNIKTGKSIIFESGNTIDLKSKNVRIGASESMSVSGGKGLFLESRGGDVHMKSSGNVFMNPEQNLFLRADGGTISMQAKGSLRMSSESFMSIKSEGYMAMKSSGSSVLIGAGQSVNINAADKMGILGAEIFIESSGGDTNISSGGLTNIGSTGDISISSSSNLFTQATGDINTKGVNVNIESSSSMDIRGGGTTSIEAVGGNMNLLASSDAYLTGSTVYIDDIVQLASGATAGGTFGADDGNEVQSKEPVDPAEFSEGTGEMGGSIADQAVNAEQPVSAPSGSNGPATPPDRSAPNPRRTESATNNTTTNTGSSTTDTSPGSIATQPGAINLNEPNIIASIEDASGRRALVRLPENGKIINVRVGAQLNGGVVTSISETELKYSVNGTQDRTLRIPD